MFKVSHKMESSWFDQFVSDESDPYSSKDADCEPCENIESHCDDYNSDDSDAVYVEENVKEAAITEPNVMLSSKDKQVQYSIEPLPLARRTCSFKSF